MKVLVTGSQGFIGRNLIENLKAQTKHKILEFDKDSDISLLDSYCKQTDFVFHLAGVNRPENEKEFMEGNFGFTDVLLKKLKKYRNKCPVLITSSTQAGLDNPYGKSKKAGEDLMLSYSLQTCAEVLVYRLPNVFGKWCRPNYNSAVATFCHNIANDLPLTINNKKTVLNLVYIDDVIDEFILALNGRAHKNANFCYVPVTYTESLGRIAKLLCYYKDSRKTLSLPKLSNGFEKALYSTYLSYLPKDGFAYPLKVNSNARGSFTEIFKTDDRGQFSVNKSEINITKGNHWHNTKCEKFAVVSGEALIRFRKVGTDEITEYYVNGKEIKVVDIPPGYTHNIINIGDNELITFMWASEIHNCEKPDTFHEEV